MVSGTEIVDLVIKLLTVAGAVGGGGAFLMVRAQKNKLIAETGKTSAEADTLIADAQIKRTDREVSLLEPYERIQRRVGRELNEAYEEIDRLRAWATQLTTALKAAGIPVPDEPPRMPDRVHPDTNPEMRAVRR